MVMASARMPPTEASASRRRRAEAVRELAELGRGDGAEGTRQQVHDEHELGHLFLHLGVVALRVVGAHDRGWVERRVGGGLVGVMFVADEVEDSKEKILAGFIGSWRCDHMCAGLLLTG